MKDFFRKFFAYTMIFPATIWIYIWTWIIFDKYDADKFIENFYS